MASKKNTAIMDDSGISCGTEMTSKRTVEKSFELSSKSSDWPSDEDGKPVKLIFNLVIDLNGVMFEEILDDAIRTKVITVQNALRGTGKDTTPFEVLQEMSKKPIHRHYNTCGVTPTNPEKALREAQKAFSSLSPEMQAQFMKQLAGV